MFHSKREALPKKQSPVLLLLKVSYFIDFLKKEPCSLSLSFRWADKKSSICSLSGFPYRRSKAVSSFSVF